MVYNSSSTPAATPGHPTSLHPPLSVKEWPDTMTATQMLTLIILPIVSFLVICLCLWLMPVSIEYQQLRPSRREPKERDDDRERDNRKLRYIVGGRNINVKEDMIQTNPKEGQQRQLSSQSIQVVVPPPSHCHVNTMATTGSGIQGTGNYHKKVNYDTISHDHHEKTTSTFRLSRSFIEEGEISGDYSIDWKYTFDYYFLLFMVLVFLCSIAYTYYFYPIEFYSLDFWIIQWMKLGLMMSVSCIGGLICRYFSLVDERGYILTNKNSKFKVNYTRKLQHFAAYIIPLLIKPYGETTTNFITVLWGDYFTLLNFLLLIKPIRESCTFFMLQFNSLDRPEDRPHTLKWIIAGNIIPGFIILLFFHWLFSPDYTSLLYIIIFITGIGDGLAEPIGVTWGRHKYKIKNWFSEKKYTRSLEGSTCVFMSGMIFPALQYYDFDNFYEVLISMIVLAPSMAYAEATAPHTLDTPVLMIGCGTILYAITSLI